MAKTLISALALASLPSALAFRNTSPFFLVSTSDLNIDDNDVQLAQSSAVTAQMKEVLKDCPSSSYFVVRQEGVSLEDFETEPTTSPNFLLKNSANALKSVIKVPDVLGNVDSHVATAYLQENCGAEVVRLSLDSKESDYPQEELPEGAPAHIYELDVTASEEDSYTKMAASSSFINYAVSRFARDGQYTIIYTTTPSIPSARPSEHAYEMEDPFGDAVQMELKRDLSSHRRADDESSKDEGGLFERYQYLSPGLFMGISATIPLVLILLVGLRAISGLEVSYFAFSKEMGPGAQKK